MAQSEVQEPFEKNPFPINFKCRMWNVVSRQNSSLLRRHPSQSDLVECDGRFTDLEAEVRIKDSKKDHYVLLFNDTYAMVTNGEGGSIKAIDLSKLVISSLPATEFKPIRNGNYWLFQTETSSGSELYLGCQEDGNTTLVKMKEKDFPNPQALFIVNEIN